MTIFFLYHHWLVSYYFVLIISRKRDLPLYFISKKRSMKWLLLFYVILFSPVEHKFQEWLLFSIFKKIRISDMCLHGVVFVVVISIWLHHIHDVTPFGCHSTWISLVTLVSAICDGFLNWSILFNCKHRLFHYCVEKNKPLRSIYLYKLTKEDAELNTGFRAVYI